MTDEPLRAAPPPNTEAFAAWLREARRVRGVSQQRLADAIGAERKAPGRWEAGGGISSTSYRRLLDFFDVDVEQQPAIQRRQLDRIEGKLDRVLLRLGIVDEHEVAAEASVAEVEDMPGAGDRDDKSA